MRYFEPIEKEVIDYLCNAEPISEASTIQKLFETICDCSMIWKNEIATIFIKNPSDSKGIVRQILNIICLLDYLKSQGFIYLFRNIKESNGYLNEAHEHIDLAKECEFIKSNNGEPIPAINFESEDNKGQVALNPVHLSKDISKKIFDFLNCSFFCSETLRHIKNQKYKDDETIQFEKNRRQTWYAIGVSFLVGIIGVIGTFMTYFQNERFHSESLDISQKATVIHDTIKNSTEKITQENLPLKSNDTTKFIYK